MRRLKIGWFSVLFMTSLLVAAQTRVHRCRDRDGHWIFQGQPCPEARNDISSHGRDLGAIASRTGATEHIGCRSKPLRFRFADPAVDGALIELVLHRDAGGYQILLNLGGVIEREHGLVPAQFSARLDAQGLRFDDGELFPLDFRRGDKQLGYGYARSAMLLKRANEAVSLVAEIEPEGYSQALWSAPIPASVLAAMRAEVLRCQLAAQHRHPSSSIPTRTDDAPR